MSPYQKEVHLFIAEARKRRQRAEKWLMYHHL